MVFAKKNKGFTLIELMIVVAIIAIIAAIAIPTFLRAKINANEGAAIATLKGIHAFQALFQSSATLDFNANGAGEFGTMGELSGAYLRTLTNAGANGTPQPFCPASLQPQIDGISRKTGYSFVVFLPSLGGAPITDASDVAATAAGNVQDAILQESLFRGYAWPSVFNNTGLRCFAVNQNGEILIASNDSGGNVPFYDGTTSTPNFDAAVSTAPNAPAEVGAQFNGIFISGTTGVDTQLWVSAGG
ncbi:prepilin-type N-terminal cleavage/methylation domain-containing protein [Candidatus Uabimicrobium amorphum]|uniref:Prepilin-type N-terminal cleavage/methylation domain-containing protein n=1 Tax=Uabimicrobium amorphum TaxID=2596890 RepID=A0A5S9IPK3_UABAM|nr:prepilin-type N-terminal cleavage/methylation domain-containing protein [Candidatus Uabimicrobium amorphum]